MQPNERINHENHPLGHRISRADVDRASSGYLVEFGDEMLVFDHNEFACKHGMDPTVKPVQMIADAIKDVSARGDIVLDLFGGSGSTLIAAEKTGRRAFLCEIDEQYCDVTIKHYENYAHDEAIMIENLAEEVDS